MRLTILINGSDSPANHDYAVLWLDTDKRVWSRESHAGIDLPAWGEMKDEDDGMKLCSHSVGTPVCTLSGLHVDSDQHVATAQGAAEWSCASTRAPMEGLWRLQAVEKKSVLPENSVFPN